MQTFLPFPSFTLSAECLDRQRLGKQRVEAKQIYLALTQPSYGWQSHPAVAMWRGHSTALAHYGLTICQEWINRGYNDTLFSFFATIVENDNNLILPRWLGDEAFHLSHRSNLLRKLPSHYSPLFSPLTPSDLPYIWPKP